MQNHYDNLKKKNNNNNLFLKFLQEISVLFGISFGGCSYTDTLT